MNNVIRAVLTAILILIPNNLSAFKPIKSSEIKQFKFMMKTNFYKRDYKKDIDNYINEYIANNNLYKSPFDRIAVHFTETGDLYVFIMLDLYEEFLGDERQKVLKAEPALGWYAIYSNILEFKTDSINKMQYNENIISLSFNDRIEQWFYDRHYPFINVPFLYEELIIPLDLESIDKFGNE